MSGPNWRTVPPLVFVLVGCAAVMHATWNVILKAGGDPLRTSGRRAWRASPSACRSRWGVGSLGAPSVPIEAIALAVVSGTLEFLYFVFLSAAYRRGELSVVYPIARGSAPLLAVAAGVILLGERLGPEGAMGVAALAAGILALQRPWRALRQGAGQGGAGIFALATGVTIAAYSAVDRVGARLVEPWLYAAMLFSVSTALLLLWIRFVDGRLGRVGVGDGFGNTGHAANAVAEARSVARRTLARRLVAGSDGSRAHRDRRVLARPRGLHARAAQRRCAATRIGGGARFGLGIIPPSRSGGPRRRGAPDRGRRARRARGLASRARIVPVATDTARGTGSRRPVPAAAPRQATTPPWQPWSDPR